jgi:hypothetical protein
MVKFLSVRFLSQRVCAWVELDAAAGAGRQRFDCRLPIAAGLPPVYLQLQITQSRMVVGPAA